MESTFFFLALSRLPDKSVMEVDYQLKKPIHGANTIRVVFWDVTWGRDYVMCPLLGGLHEKNEPRVDMPVLAFGSGGVALGHEQHQIDQNNSTIKRLILRMKKSDNKEYSIVD